MPFLSPNQQCQSTEGKRSVNCHSDSGVYQSMWNKLVQVYKKRRDKVLSLVKINDASTQCFILRVREWGYNKLNKLLQYAPTPRKWRHEQPPRAVMLEVTTAHVGDEDSIRIPRLKFAGVPVLKIWLTFGHGVKRPGDVDLWPFDLLMGSRVTCVLGFLLANFQLATPFRFRVSVRQDRHVDRWTTAIKAFSLTLWGRGHKKWLVGYNMWSHVIARSQVSHSLVLIRGL